MIEALSLLAGGLVAGVGILALVLWQFGSETDAPTICPDCREVSGDLPKGDDHVVVHLARCLVCRREEARMLRAADRRSAQRATVAS